MAWAAPLRPGALVKIAAVQLRSSHSTRRHNVPSSAATGADTRSFRIERGPIQSISACTCSKRRWVSGVSRSPNFRADFRKAEARVLHFGEKGKVRRRQPVGLSERRRQGVRGVSLGWGNELHTEVCQLLAADADEVFGGDHKPQLFEERLRAVRGFDVKAG